MKEMWKNINKKYIVIGLFILLAVLVIVLGMVGVNSLNNIKCTSETTVGEITIKDEIRIKLVKGKVGYVKENKIIKVSDKSKREEAYYPALEKTIKSAYKYLGEDNYDENISSYKVIINSVKQGDKYVWGDPGISFKLRNYWLPLGTRIKNTFIDFGEASVAVIKGIASLFTGGIQNMSGIVGIFSMSSEILSNYTFNTYIYLWGLISVNLALFNLIPFPGLDGWALLVTAIEGGVNFVRRRTKKHIDEKGNYVEWKIPSKVKNIVSNVGLALLFILMIAIVGLDIARLIG